MHQRIDRELNKMEELNYLIPIVDEVRLDHPKMSLRYIFQMVKPKTIGRDAFEHQFSELGYKVRIERNYRKTTDSSGVIRFNNLVKGRELSGVNQVWVSDITYYEMGGKFHYLTFITDLYTRKIIGACSSSSLRTVQTTLPALRKALQTRKDMNLEGTIIHSDGGGQYYSKEFVELTRQSGLVNSMGKDVYDNPHAERINGIIKNNYVIPYGPNTPVGLAKALVKAVYMYNSQKPHSALGGLSPDNYEEIILNSEEIKKEKSSKIKNSNSNKSNLITVNAI